MIWPEFVNFKREEPRRDEYNNNEKKYNVQRKWAQFFLWVWFIWPIFTCCLIIKHFVRMILRSFSHDVHQHMFKKTTITEEKAMTSSSSSSFDHTHTQYKLNRNSFVYHFEFLGWDKTNESNRSRETRLRDAISTISPFATLIRFVCIFLLCRVPVNVNVILRILSMNPTIL